MRKNGSGYFFGGFTLIELLACMALVAIVLPVAMAGVSLATSTAGLARQQLEAATLAESKLTELAVTGLWQTSSLTGDFSPDWPSYHWIAQVTPYSSANVQQLDLSVTWTARGRDYSVALTTLVYSGSAQ